MPLSTSMSRPPSSTSRQRMDQEQRLLLSGGFIFCQMVFGTTPNMAPPSSLKLPVSIAYSFMVLLLLFGKGEKKPEQADAKKYDQGEHAVLHAQAFVDIGKDEYTHHYGYFFGNVVEAEKRSGIACFGHQLAVGRAADGLDAAHHQANGNGQSIEIIFGIAPAFRKICQLVGSQADQDPEHDHADQHLNIINIPAHTCQA